MSELVTLWYRRNERGEFEFNHLEEGHVPQGVGRPTPKKEAQKSIWAKGEWRHEQLYLSGRLPPKVSQDPVEDEVDGSQGCLNEAEDSTTSSVQSLCCCVHSESDYCRAAVDMVKIMLDHMRQLPPEEQRDQLISEAEEFLRI